MSSAGHVFPEPESVGDSSQLGNDVAPEPGNARAEPPAERFGRFIARMNRLFIANPMRMEVRRFKSKFVNCTSSPAFNRALVWLVGLCYLSILGLVFTAREDVHPLPILLIQSILSLLVSVVASHGAIAAERERRSWDLLQSAPVTQAEIVVGKFQGLVAVILSVAVAFIPMIAIGYAFHSHYYGRYPSLGETLIAEGIAISASIAAAAFTVNLSSKMRSANAVLASSIVWLVGLLAALPAAIAALVSVNATIGGSPSTSTWDTILCWHPIYVLVRILDASSQPFPAAVGLLQVPILLSLSWFFLARSVWRLKATARE